MCIWTEQFWIFPWPLQGQDLAAQGSSAVQFSALHAVETRHVAPSAADLKIEEKLVQFYHAERKHSWESCPVLWLGSWGFICQVLFFRSHLVVEYFCGEGVICWWCYLKLAGISYQWSASEAALLGESSRESFPLGSKGFGRFCPTRIRKIQMWPVKGTWLQRCSFAEFAAVRCSVNIIFPFLRYYFLLCLSKGLFGLFFIKVSVLHPATKCSWATKPNSCLDLFYSLKECSLQAAATCS